MALRKAASKSMTTFFQIALSSQKSLIRALSFVGQQSVNQEYNCVFDHTMNGKSLVEDSGATENVPSQ